ncbi:MCP methyltransferase, CheR-type [Malonomonas rubra DSM 5091]|uniref:protein-glutamate O-methyltransferase n=1 Tax=Malonomonas rubra DSM 5091 TaxID=1122189 RepID=A0A1M6IRK3_MALRU|nr:protein-glutamate O-methyltransferase [Malonomonas rubra]SHJ37017.1 MCP methyltransferase, CheR-type [Malonomonas rubra DSM 5091]
MQATLSQKDFDRLSQFIYNELGIKMPSSKTTMLTGRLNKRLRALRLKNFTEYCDFLFSDKGKEEEMVHLINAVTTNKTDFFREPSHFDYLVNTALPELEELRRYEPRRKLRIWSAGCSTGEEPYTMAMVLAEVAEQNKSFSFDILATDISTRVLDVARRAVYPMERIDPVDNLYRRKYLLRGKDKQNPQIRIVPELRKKIRFGRLNFMAADFGLPEMVDIIFCRNVIIYFDKQTQEQLMNKFSRYLNRGGYLFLGHSESLHGYQTPFTQVAPTIYRKLQ